jgi:hypothetical protein
VKTDARMTRASFQYGFQRARGDLGWTWPTTLGVGALLCIAGAAAIEAQSIQTANGARRVELHLLAGVTFGLVIPLFSFALSGRIDAGLRALLTALWVRHGARRRAFALGSLALPAALTALLGLLGAVFALGLGSASAGRATSAIEPELAVASVGVATLIAASVLAALSYTAYLALAELLGGAWGRALFLVADWLLGSSSGALGVIWPRAHVRALLGGASVLGMSRLQTTGCLLALTLACLLVYLRRIPR